MYSCVDHEVAAPTAKASAIFGRLSHVRKKPMIKRATKIKILGQSVYLIQLYRAETWPTSVAVQHRVNTFQSKWFRTIEGIQGTDFVSNDGLQSKTLQLPLLHLVAEWTRRWFGHLLRLPTTPAWILYDFEPTSSDWKRLRGRPKFR
ncbi:uncharacterized protein LOC136030610 [Artemia franciscana]|uniref:uncharacterized protein LOC136030610 n=1 Tax=Artemia franciscana TaxID=6661 RepID=UPI0032DB2EDE